MCAEAYMETLAIARALLLSEEDSLAGSTLLSIECQSEFSDDNIEDYIQGHIRGFLIYLRFLPTVDQDLLLSYYLTGLTQNTLALIYKSTQTMCSADLRRAVKTLTTILMFKGQPTVEQLAPIFQDAKLDVTTLVSRHYAGPVSLTDLIASYLETQSFADTAEIYGVHRPQVRRAIREAAGGPTSLGQPRPRVGGLLVGNADGKHEHYGHRHRQESPSSAGGPGTQGPGNCGRVPVRGGRQRF
jgi:hypothetical protein